MISGEKTILLALEDKSFLKKAVNEENCPAADTEPFFSKKARVFAVELRETGEKVGVIALSVDEKNRSGRFDIAVLPDMRGKGVGTDASAAFLRFAFAEYGLNRIYASHSVKNSAAGFVLRKTGMSYEGMSRERFYNASGYHDTHNYAILKREVV
ncbi:MAG: GNAT family N-acetyltransferase [Clostridia bacterium]|nr:GNAT family N-acetyltransferase [Clostridia bacterium]